MGHGNRVGSRLQVNRTGRGLDETLTSHGQRSTAQSADVPGTGIYSIVDGQRTAGNANANIAGSRRIDRLTDGGVTTRHQDQVRSAGNGHSGQNG